MTQQVAYFNGEFCAVSDLKLSVDDLGFLQGVCVSERVRTFDGTLFRLADHLTRLAHSLKILDLLLDDPLSRLGDIAEELVARNGASRVDGDDLGLSLFVTPGIPNETTMTVGMLTYPLPFGQWASYYTQGQALTETGIRQIPPSCWPPMLKCRSRMHYYLADQQARKLDVGSRAILLDQDGFVSEASTANIVIYQKERGFVSPRLEKILPGVSLSVLTQLAADLDIPMYYDDLRLEDVSAAEEILLCSTSPCVWPVTRLNGQPTRSATERPIYRRLLAAWSDLVGLDIAGQAQRFADRC